ncbi:hypothetical protein CEQ90_01680 [Lewinellaceae bacterium SD302]|nr:hypothetical protein CEQ90_01680 [Lewinellaceae bacterium SD302]
MYIDVDIHVMALTLNESRVKVGRIAKATTAAIKRRSGMYYGFVRSTPFSNWRRRRLSLYAHAEKRREEKRRQVSCAAVFSE